MHEIIRQAVDTYSGLRDSCWQVIQESAPSSPLLSNFAHSHLYYFSERCQSVNVLLQNDKLWDCEILMRPALECITRFIFVCIADKENQLLRIEEFQISLSQINSISVSEKAKKAAYINANHEITSVLIGGASLPDEELERLRNLWPKKKRQALNQKWSFSEMAREISSFKNDQLDLTAYPSLLHSYGISSHLIHADQTAIELVWDRNHRESKEYDLLIKSHTCRLLCDQNFFLFLSLKALLVATGIPHGLAALENSIVRLMNICEPYQQNFYESQKDLYKEHKKNSL